jgi:hypothetical protein
MKDTAKRESLEEGETLPLRQVEVVRQDLRAGCPRAPGACRSEVRGSS